MTMQSDFESILAMYGHDVFLQRVSTSDTGEMTYSDTLERHTTRYNVPNNRSLPGSQQEQMEGLLSTSERIYYFKISSQPFDGDRIYEEDPRAPGGQTVWSIDTVLILRGLGGAPVYYAAGATRIKPN